MNESSQVREPALEIVIVTYNGKDLVRGCLGSLAAHLPVGLPTLIHVVDNASSDGTPQTVATDYPHVRLLARSGNDGFAVANNAALRSVTAPYVLVLNPDTEIRPGVIEHLLEVLGSEPEIGMIGCRLTQADGTFDHAAKRSFPSARDALAHLWGGRRRRGGRYLAPHVEEFGTGDVDSLNGAFMLVRTSAMREVGLFDEQYWMYGEDLDWCRRFGQAGWRVRYDGRVTALHVKGGISGKHRALRLNYQFYRSMAVFYRKFDAGQNTLKDAAVYAGIAGAFAYAAAKSALTRGLAR